MGVYPANEEPDGMFETNPVHLSELIRDIDRGAIQLPEFQRGWVWDDGRIKDLLTSVIRKFPVGAIMMLENGGKLAFKRRPITGANVDEETEPEEFILDGQQRLTSLFQTLRSEAPVTTKVRKRNVTRVYFVDILRAIDPHQNDFIVSMPDSLVQATTPHSVDELNLSSPEKQYKNHMIPTGKLMDPMTWQLGYLKHWEGNPKHDALATWAEFNEKVLTHLGKYQLPVLKLNKEVAREAVCLVFEKVNTGGIVLTAFELLTAALAAEGFDLRADWEERERRFAEDALLSSVTNIPFLQVVAMLSNDGRGCDRGDILNVTRKQYKKWEPEAERGFVKAATFLKSLRIFRGYDLPYVGQLVSLATLFARMGRDLDTQIARQRLAQWYWSGVFGEEYGSTTATRIVEDVRGVPTLIRDGVPTDLMNRFHFDPVRVVSLRTRGSAAYKGLFALQMKAGCADWATGEDIDEIAFNDRQIDIHHIFPKAWFSGPGVQKLGGDIDSKIIDSSVNKAPLSAATNKLLGGDAPSIYAQELRKHNPGIEDALEKSFVRIADIDNDDFVRFFAWRACKLVEMVYGAAGKPSPTDCHEVISEHLQGFNLVDFTDDYDDDDESDDDPAYSSRP